MKNACRALVLVSALFAPAFAGIIDSVNESGTLCTSIGCTFVPTDLGWLYTAPFSYSLTSVAFEFGSGDGRTVTEEIFSPTTPALGGALLGSATFVPVAGSFVGGAFAPISIIGGQTYFVGLLNVAGLIGPIATDAGATNLLVAADSDGSGTFSSGIFHASSSGNVIMEFNGTAAVPEPATLSLLASGLSLCAALRLFRRSRVSA
jgi:hypothetical protein